MKILVSACLVGDNCKYNGKNNLSKKLVEFLEGKDYVKVCPEMLGIHRSPRLPVEIVDGQLLDSEGNNLTDVYLKGVELALEQAGDIDVAILQSRSPTCGVKQVYDGTFSGKLIDGMGTFAQKLKEKEIKVIDIEDFKEDLWKSLQ